MSSNPLSARQRYLLGLAGLVAGAGVTSAVDSMWPLALGSSFAVICTAALVRDIRARAAARRLPQRRTKPRP